MSVYFTDIQQERIEKEDEHNILILGSTGSGKTTFLKQMQIIHGNGLGDISTRMDKKPLIAGNIVSAMGTLIRKMTLAQENQLHAIEALSKAVGRVSRMPNFHKEATFGAMRYDEKLVQDRADDIKLLWDCEPIQATYERRNEFQIVECAQYFLSKVHEVMQPGYVPTDDDILQIRDQTIGITDYQFQMHSGGRDRKLLMVSI